MALCNIRMCKFFIRRKFGKQINVIAKPYGNLQLIEFVYSAAHHLPNIIAKVLILAILPTIPLCSIHTYIQCSVRTCVWLHLYTIAQILN